MLSFVLVIWLQSGKRSFVSEWVCYPVCVVVIVLRGPNVAQKSHEIYYNPSVNNNNNNNNRRKKNDNS